MSVGGPGLFALPNQDFTGRCNDNNYAEFAVDETHSCTRTLGSDEFNNGILLFESQCNAGVVSTFSLVDRLLVAATP
jgi:hypothetical protein